MSNIPVQQQRRQKTTQPPTINPNGNTPNNPNDDIVSFTIKIQRQYYNLFVKFAQFLYNQPAQNPNTGEIIIDPKTNKPVHALPAPDIATYFLTCAFNTYQSYQMVMNMVKQKQAQAQQTSPAQQ